MCAFIACMSLSACQELDTPIATNPTVKTMEASGVEGRKAYFSGTVNADANCFFLLSTTANLTDPITIAATTSKSESDNNLYCSSEYEGLTPGTTYYLALCASDGVSEEMGNIVSFTTPTFLTVANVYLSDIDGYSTNSYAPEQPLGLFLLSNWESSYSVWNSYSNIKAEYSNSEIVLSQDIRPTSNIKVFAYHPYTEQLSGNSIPVKANESYYGTPTASYFYGYSNTINGDDTEATINLRYALSKITLSVTNANGNDGSTLTNVTIGNQEGEQHIASSGEMNVFTGNISNLQDYVDQSKDCSQTLTSSAYKVDFMLIPTSFQDNQVVVKMTINGKTLETTLPASTWSKGAHYTYYISVDKDELSVKE